MMETAAVMHGSSSERVDAQLARVKFALRFVGWGWTAFFALILLNELMDPPLWARDSLIGSLVCWGHGGREYLLMLCAINIPLGVFLVRSARAPEQNRMFIDFAVLTNVVHLTTMLVMAIMQAEQHSNLVGDVPAGLLPNLILGALWLPVRARARQRHLHSLKGPALSLQVCPSAQSSSQ